MSVFTVGVVGAGQMGAGIAQLAAKFESAVYLADQSVEIAERAKAGIERRLLKALEKQKIGRRAMAELLERITPISDLSELGTADVVIEAATEDPDLKLDLFRRLGGIVGPKALLASNTSAISITLLASVTKKPERVVGMHFMNPAPVMELVEIIPGLTTTYDTVSRAQAIAASWGKTTAEARDFPGFIVNRLLIPFLNEACAALTEGVGTVEDIDAAITLGLAHPMGPFQLADLIGLDTVLAISRVLYNGFNDSKYRPSPLLIKYVEAGWLGRKTGKGFYIY